MLCRKKVTKKGFPNIFVAWRFRDAMFSITDFFDVFIASEFFHHCFSDIYLELKYDFTATFASYKFSQKFFSVHNFSLYLPLYLKTS